MDNLVIIIAQCNSDTKGITTTKYSIGNIIKIDKKLYIITCYHGLEKFITITMLQNNKKYKLDCSAIFPEYDLALLKPHHNIKCNTWFTQDDFNYGVDNMNCVLPFIILDIYKKRLVVNKSQYKKPINRYELEHCRSFIAPETLFAYIKLDFIDLDETNLDGTSGTFVFDNNNKVIGMINSIRNGELRILHISIIHRFLLEYFVKGCIKGVCVLPIAKQFNIINKKIPGYIIKNTYKIKYDTELQLKKDDIIININDTNLSRTETLYDKFTNSSLPIDTYILLYYLEDSSLKIKLLRKDGKRYKLLTGIIKVKLLKDVTKIHYELDNKYYLYCNMKFSELTENIIQKISLLHDLDGECMRLYKNSYTNELNSTIIGLIDILRNNLNDNELEYITELGLPLIRLKKNKYCIPIVKTINGKSINNIEHMVKVLQDYENKIITIELILNTNNHITIKCKNENILY
jgi:hypothetical protein